MIKEIKKETLKFNKLFPNNKERNEKRKRGFFMKKTTIAALIIFFLIGVATAILLFQPGWMPFEIKSKNKKEAVNLILKSSGYQAVFLTNGQVYFGKLEKEESVYAYLTNVYYLRLKQPLQEQKESSPSALSQQNLTLIKLGNELHGPMDKIKINKDHILFIEDLTENSKVIQAIKQYQGQ